MTNDIMVNAAAGAAFSEIFNGSRKVITHVTKRTIHFQSYLEGLKSTLSRLEVLVEDIRQSQKELGRSPAREIDDLDELVKKGNNLVDECSKLKWWKQSIRFAYADKLRKMDKELLVFFQRDIMARIMRDLSETAKLVNKIPERLNTVNTHIPTKAPDQQVLDGKLTSIPISISQDQASNRN